MTPDQEGDSLAALLRELKDRSGHSYGVLAKRLHMSTSTLHRYCNGDAVPAEFAPVDRLGRLCGAKPEELVELHRRWILADAARARKKEGGAAAAEARSASAAPPPKSSQAPGPSTASQSSPPSKSSPSPQSSPSSPGSRPSPPSRPSPSAQAAQPSPPPSERPSERPSDDARQPPLTSTRTVQPQGKGPNRRRPVLIGAATALIAVLAVSVTSGLLGDEGGSSQDRAAAQQDGGAAGPSAGASDSAAEKAKEKAKGGRGDRDGSPGEDGGKKGGADAEKGAPGKGGGTGGSGEAPLSVSLSDDVWNINKNCLQSFLIDREPEQVGEFTGGSSTTWARGFGGVDAKNSNIGAIVQGTDDQKVVLKALRAKVVSRGPALKWNHYDSASGCGSRALVPASYDITLDNASPQVKPVPGEQQDGKPSPAKPFPRTVSANDPEALAIKANTANCDCRWYLELDWSSGDRSGTVRIDDGGRPFRTSGVKTKERYTFSNKPPYWVLVKANGMIAEQPSEEPSEQPGAAGR